MIGALTFSSTKLSTEPLGNVSGFIARWILFQTHLLNIHFTLSSSSSRAMFVEKRQVGVESTIENGEDSSTFCVHVDVLRFYWV